MTVEGVCPNVVGELEAVATGFKFPEGPRWRNGKLWFSDVLGRRVLRLDPARKDGPDVIAELEDRPSGLGFLPDGTLLIVSMEQRLILRHSHGKLNVHADLTDLECTWLNDMVVGVDGIAYVGTRVERGRSHRPS